MQRTLDTLESRPLFGPLTRAEGADHTLAECATYAVQLMLGGSAFCGTVAASLMPKMSSLLYGSFVTNRVAGLATPRVLYVIPRMDTKK